MLFFKTLSFLLDQENYFMPRYLAINEIKSVLTFGKESYHVVNIIYILIYLFRSIFIIKYRDFIICLQCLLNHLYQLLI
jgi:hypothetical protein